MCFGGERGGDRGGGGGGDRGGGGHRGGGGTEGGGGGGQGGTGGGQGGGGGDRRWGSGFNKWLGFRLNGLRLRGVGCWGNLGGGTVMVGVRSAHEPLSGCRQVVLAAPTVPFQTL